MEALQKNSERIQKINAFMNALNAADKHEKKAIVDAYRTTLDAVTPLDIFYVDMYKDTSTLSADTIKESANRFVNVFYKSLRNYEFKDHHHHFFQALLEENEAIIKHLKSMKPHFKNDKIVENRQVLLKGFEQCLAFEKKYVKKENIFFPRLESRVPSTRPLEVMWSLHDDARAQLKQIIAYLQEQQLQVKPVKELIGTYYYLVYGIIQKEVLILFPVAAKFLDDDELDAMYDESMQYGFTFLEKEPRQTKEDVKETFSDHHFTVRNGQLDFNQLNLMLNHLPVDITFVDKDDRVRYFNDSKNRHFPRNPSIIGRLVEHCHPPKSVETVKRIVEAFKKGEKDFAEFWITFKGSFLYISYYAIYDDKGNYEGILEVSQDVTRIRKLDGEQRLLNWDK